MAKLHLTGFIWGSTIKHAVLSPPARIVLRASRHENCTLLLQQLQWLPISERIKYKTACVCYNAVTIKFSVFYYLLSYCTLTVLPAVSARRQQHVRFNHVIHGFALSHASVSTAGTISPKHQALCYSGLHSATLAFTLLLWPSLCYSGLHSATLSFTLLLCPSLCYSVLLQKQTQDIYLLHIF